MYFLCTLEVPKELEEEILLLFCENIPRGWEWEEKEKSIYFRLYLKKEELENLKSFIVKYPISNLKISKLEDKNWSSYWKEYFKPLEVGKKLVILPPWEKTFFQEKILIYIEPAQAFGTGYHPTTQLMLESIELFFEKLIEDRFLEVLDFGCGTGILGIACIKLYKDLKLYAVDIDELALEATLKNAKLNGVEDKFVVLRTLPLDKKFDLILANLSFKELKKEALNLCKVSKKGITKLFLSGILIEDVGEIKNLYESLGFICEMVREKEEWTVLEFFYA